MAEEQDIIYEIIEGCPDWMLTMGDCMSLLMCFFVLLLTYTTPDEQKMMEILGGIKGALSTVSFIRPTYTPNIYKQSKDPEKAVDGEVVDGEIEKIKISPKQVAAVKLRSLKIVNKIQETKDYLKKQGFLNKIEVVQLEEGITIVLNQKELFYDKGTQYATKINPDKARNHLVPIINLLNSAPGNEIAISIKLGNKLKGKRTFSSELDSALERQNNLGKYLSSEDDWINKRRLSYHFSEEEEDDKITITLVELFDINNVTIDELIKTVQER